MGKHEDWWRRAERAAEESRLRPVPQPVGGAGSAAQTPLRAAPPEAFEAEPRRESPEGRRRLLAAMFLDVGLE